VEVPVIAWGLGLDRLAMLALGLDDIRDLVTPELSRLREMVIRPEELLRGREG
jgi:phenylalanyl-tRNA synthetase alpha chain